MYAWSAWGEPPEDEFRRRAAISSHRFQRTQELTALWPLILDEVDWWLKPSAIRTYSLEDDGSPIPVLQRDSQLISTDAALMEAALLIRALTIGRSRLSSHPLIAPELAELSSSLGAAGSAVLVLLIRANQQTEGVVSVHWSGSGTTFHAPPGFYTLWDDVGFSLAKLRERERLERVAYTDPMTGLPNYAGLDRQLDRHEQTYPFGVLVADFDGMREANTAFSSYELGGDVLIRAVADELRRVSSGEEFAARLHTRGDEFCVLLPGAGEEATARRAHELEAALDGLQVPESHRHVYRGASVGFASRLPEESPGQTLGRASEAMHARKKQRRDDR